MKDVLSVLRSYDNIHGIIILLKPNNSRLTFMFRFVIQELLTHLHQSAARNMVYAFTNTRGTNFTPGDSFVPLEELLNEFKKVLPPLSQSNIYCFDSESFRYLAAKKQAGLDLGGIEDYRRSWEKSSRESQRLRNHFQTIQPHPVKNTVSLNATRYLIETLVAPMLQVSKTILRSISESEKKRLELDQTNATGEDLKAKLRIPKTVVEAHESDRHVTACNHIDCVKKVDGKPERAKTSNKIVEEEKIRKSLCKFSSTTDFTVREPADFSPGHNPCSLREIRAYVPGALGLKGCAAFDKNNGVCYTCKHGWRDHEHILVWYTEMTEITDDPEVVLLLSKTNNEVKAKAAALGALDNQIAEFKEEHRKIQEAAAKFTVYMQQNSITVYNDAALEYLRHLIKEENVKVQLGGDDTRLEALKKECEQYQAYVDTIHTARKRGLPGAVPDEQGVSRLVQELYSMKHYGKDLQKVANTVSRAYAATFRETAYRVRPKHYYMRARGYTSHGGQDSHRRGQPYSSMLDIGSSSVRMSPSRRGGCSQRVSLGDMSSLPWRQSQKARPAEYDASWRTSYARCLPKQSPACQKTATKAFLPFDDDIGAEPRLINNSTPSPEKTGSSIFSTGTDGRAELNNAMGGEPATRAPSLLNWRKKY
jgi:hypothetical protein